MHRVEERRYDVSDQKSIGSEIHAVIIQMLSEQVEVLQDCTKFAQSERGQAEVDVRVTAYVRSSLLLEPLRRSDGLTGAVRARVLVQLRELMSKVSPHHYATGQEISKTIKNLEART